MSQSTTEIRIVPPPPAGRAHRPLRDGARRLLAQAIEAKSPPGSNDHAHLKDETGRRQVVRNGHLPSGHPTHRAIEVQQPRSVTAGPPTGGRRSPGDPAPYLRKPRAWRACCPGLPEGVSTGDFSEALQAILGPDAPGLSATTVTG